MKSTEDVRKYSAELGIAEEEALKKGMEEKNREFAEMPSGKFRLWHGPRADVAGQLA